MWDFGSPKDPNAASSVPPLTEDVNSPLTVIAQRLYNDDVRRP